MNEKVRNMKEQQENNTGTKRGGQDSQSDAAEEKMLFGLVLGSLYLLAAILQALVLVGVLELSLVPPEILGVCVLGVLGAVCLSGYHELREGVDEGVAHIYVGILLSLVFAVLYLLIMGADALEAYVLKNEDFADWTPLDDMRPEIYLALISLAGAYRWRRDFSLMDIVQRTTERKRS